MLLFRKGNPAVVLFTDVFYFCVDLVAELCEQLLNVGAILGTNLHEVHVVFGGQFLSLFCLYLPLGRQIWLVADEEFDDVGGRVLVDLLDPVLYVLEGLLVGNGVSEYDSYGSPVISLVDVLVPLLSGSVPDL